MLMEKVATQTGLTVNQVQEVADCLVDNMGWDEIDAYNAEFRRGQIYDDAGGFFMRCIGRLIGARHRYDELTNYKKSVRKMMRHEKEI